MAPLILLYSGKPVPIYGAIRQVPPHKRRRRGPMNGDAEWTSICGTKKPESLCSSDMPKARCRGSGNYLPLWAEGRGTNTLVRIFTSPPVPNPSPCSWQQRLLSYQLPVLPWQPVPLSTVGHPIPCTLHTHCPLMHTSSLWSLPSVLSPIPNALEVEEPQEE